MAPHLSNTELDAIQKMSGQGKTAQQIHDRIRISRARGKQAQDSPNISRIYAVLKGQSFNRGPKETRGRPKLKVLSRLLCARKKLQKKHGTKTELPVGKIIKKARVRCSDSTATGLKK